jgi:hypothetical protein
MLTCCTLTGVDARTDLHDLALLAADHPFAEFGILLSRSQAELGEDPRYPSLSLIPEMLDDIAATGVDVKLALHLCGRSVEEFVGGDAEIVGLASRFDRVQLNFNAGVAKFTTAGLDAAIRSFGKPVITQWFRANEETCLALTAPNHQVLFDASGGRGIATETWPWPLPGKTCGYAGGLGPDTVRREAMRIAEVAGGEDHWIDMESRLRTPESLDLADLGKNVRHFDLELCRQVLEAVSPLVTVPSLASPTA